MPAVISYGKDGMIQQQINHHVNGIFQLILLFCNTQ